jgi:hypothetical protein
VGKPEGKRPLKRPWCRRVNNIKMDLRKTELCGMDWVYLDQNKEQWKAIMNTVTNLRVP